MGTVHLEYNATLSNSSKILDNMEFITQVQCYKNKLVLNISTEKNASFIAKDFIEQRTLVHGGSEWGCKDKFGLAKPFYFDVNSTHVEARTVILRGSHCSPFALFKRLKWSLTITPPAENERRSMPTAAADGLEGASTRIGGTWQSTFNPPPLTISDDLVQLAKAELTVEGKDSKAELGLDASAVASASFEISPLTFHWDIDVGTKDPCSCHWYTPWCCVPVVPYVSSTTMWVQLTPTFSIDLALNLGGGSLAASFEIYPDTPIDGLGVDFNIGVVSFDLGVLVGIDSKVEFEVSAPMSYTAGIAISQPMQYGFSYTGSAHGIQQLGARSVVPTSTGQLPDSINADLTFNVIPTLAFGLGGSFLSEGEFLKLEVRAAAKALSRCVCVFSRDVEAQGAASLNPTRKFPERNLFNDPNATTFCHLCDFAIRADSEPSALRCSDSRKTRFCAGRA